MEDAPQKLPAPLKLLLDIALVELGNCIVGRARFRLALPLLERKEVGHARAVEPLDDFVGHVELGLLAALRELGTRRSVRLKV